MLLFSYPLQSFSDVFSGYIPAGIYLLEVNNRNLRKKVWTMFKVIVDFEHISHFCSSVSIVNFEHIITGWVKGAAA